MDFKWIFFDIDNTLFDFSRASLESLRLLYSESLPLMQIFHSAEAFIEEFHVHNALMWQLHEQGKITSSFLRCERFRLTMFQDRHDTDAIRLSKVLDTRYLDILGSQTYTCPGAMELLSRLQGKYLIGALTNGFTDVQYRKLQSTGLNRYIQRMVISDEIGMQKPDARLFRYAEHAVGARPSEILMIGDNPASDIQGALDAGWHAAYFDRYDRGDTFVSPRYIGRFNDLNSISLQ